MTATHRLAADVASYLASPRPSGSASSAMSRALGLPVIENIVTVTYKVGKEVPRASNVEIREIRG